MRTLLILFVAAVVIGCSSGESGTVSPTVRQMKPSARGRHP